MRQSLWLKLTLAFSLAVAAATIVAMLLIDRSTTAEFGRYLEHTGMMGPMMGHGMMGLPENDFLSSVRNSLWAAAGVAIAISAAMALVLSRQVTAPLRKLSLAASQVARGDMSQRVSANSKDEIGALATAFNSMVGSLEENQRARRNLMADLAHEMSTPLSVMQSNLEAMLDGVVEPSPSNIGSLHEEALLLSRLVRDLRTLAQAESGKLELTLLPADAGAAVQAIAKTMDPEAARKGIRLSVQVDPGLPEAMVDRERLAQVLVNLLANALRYTSAGGTVSVAVRAGERSNGKRLLVVSVSDTGQGIQPDDLPHVFERYYQGSQNKEKRTGSGIGLAVVKNLVEAHGGTVWVKSEPGKGSTFFFSLVAAHP
ncbi:MAG: HAMP domain-containing protein [Chloroflexi bacterium]|nr:HAMP domain-containing protein [Chloroflexota bacterium]